MALSVLCLIPLVAQLLEGCAVDSVGGDTPNTSSNSSVELFQQYLRINTTTGNDLTPAVDFWTNLAEGEGLTISQWENATGYPVLIIRWPGTNSSLPSIMLNSHMDVVPAEAADWTYGPFDATIDADNVIWGRGTQDMKSVSIQYFEALRRLKADGVDLLRDVYMTLMPDEEVGGRNGMIPFIETEEFAAMNVGIELDEGTASPLPIYALFYQDKSIWQIQITCNGEAAHSATFPATNATATGKCRNVVDTFLNFRDTQYEIEERSTLLNSGAYTAVNLNVVNAGTANNIVPSTVDLTFDIRLATELNETTFESQIEQWVAEAGENITITYLLKDEQSAAVVTNATNPYYVAIQQAAATLNSTFYPIVSPGATDARHLRLQDVPAFGFSPMRDTPVLLHSVDERVNVTTFLDGIDIYYEILRNLANIPASSTDGLDSSSLVIQSEERALT